MKKPRTLRALLAHPWVQGWDDERGIDNGIWIYLKTGYWSPEMEATTIHEMTVAECCNVFSRVEPDLRPED